MHHGKALTDIEKDKILTFHEEKLLNREYAKRLSISEHLIRNFFKNPS